MGAMLWWLAVAACWAVSAAQHVDVSTAVAWSFPLAHDQERQRAYAEALETVVGNCVRQGTGPHAIVVLDAGLGQLAAVALRSQAAAFVGVFVPHEPALAHAATATLQAASDIHPSRYVVATSPPELLDALVRSGGAAAAGEPHADRRQPRPSTPCVPHHMQEARNVTTLCAVATDFMPKSVQHSRSHLAVVGGLIQAGFVDPANTAMVPHAMCVTAHLLHAPHVSKLTTIDTGSTAGVDMTAAFPTSGVGSSVPPPTFWAEHRPLSVRQLVGGGAATLLTLNGTGTEAPAGGAAGDAGTTGSGSCDAQWRLIDMASVRLPQAGANGGKLSAPKPLKAEVPRKAVVSGLAHAVVWWPGFLFQTRPPAEVRHPVASSGVDTDTEDSETVSLDAAGSPTTKQVKRRKRRAQRAYRLLQSAPPPLSPAAPLSPHSPHWDDVVLPLLPEPAWITAGGRSSIEVSFGPQLIVSARLASIGSRKVEDVAAAAASKHSSSGGGRGAVFPTWHISMLNDAPRNDAYAAGIREAIRSAQATSGLEKRGGSVQVLELGAGAGLLSVLAATAHNASSPQQRHQAGVYVAAVEANPSMLNRLRATVRSNGVGATVAVIPKHSTDLNVCHGAQARKSGVSTASADCDLRQPVDVVIHEVFDFTVTGEGVVPSVHDALTRLAVGADADGAQSLDEPTRKPVVVPAAVVVYGVLVESDELARLYGPPPAEEPAPPASSPEPQAAAASTASADAAGLAATASSWLQSLSTSLGASFSSSANNIPTPPSQSSSSPAAATSTSSSILAGASVLPWTSVQHPIDLNTLRHAYLHDPVALWSLDFTDPASLEPLLPHAHAPDHHSSASASRPTTQRSFAPPVCVRLSRSGAPRALVTWFSLGFAAASADEPLSFTYSTSPQAMPTADHWYQAASMLEDTAPVAAGETVTLTPLVSPHGAGGFPSVVVSVTRGPPTT